MFHPCHLLQIIMHSELQRTSSHTTYLWYWGIIQLYLLSALIHSTLANTPSISVHSPCTSIQLSWIRSLVSGGIGGGAGGSVGGAWDSEWEGTRSEGGGVSEWGGAWGWLRASSVLLAIVWCWSRGALATASLCDSVSDTKGRRNSLKPSHSRRLPIREISLNGNNIFRVKLNSHNFIILQ